MGHVLAETESFVYGAFSGNCLGFRGENSANFSPLRLLGLVLASFFLVGGFLLRFNLLL